MYQEADREEALARFLKLYEEYPNLRLAQFIGNYFNHNPDPYYQKDSQFVENLENFYHNGISKVEDQTPTPIDRDVIEDALNWVEEIIGDYESQKLLQEEEETYNEYLTRRDNYKAMLVED